MTKVVESFSLPGILYFFIVYLYLANLKRRQVLLEMHICSQELTRSMLQINIILEFSQKHAEQ